MTIHVPEGQSDYRISFPQKYNGIVKSIRIDNKSTKAIARYRLGDTQPANDIYPESYVTIDDALIEWISINTLSSSDAGVTIQAQLLSVNVP